MDPEQEDRELEHEGDLTTGDEGNPGPTGSSTGIRAPRPESPQKPASAPANEQGRARRPGVGGGGKDRVETVDDVTDGGTSPGGTSSSANRE